MGKYALILAFSYYRHPEANYELQYLHSSIHDLVMIFNLCKNMEISNENITIVTDLQPMRQLPSELYSCNLRTNPFPSDIFVCREISQFIENTIRGIQDSSYKDNGKEPEVLLYISGHGDKLSIDGKNNQGIVLTSDDGKELRYLLSKDIFNIIFGNFIIDNDGTMSIPVYSKIKTLRRIDNGVQKTNIIENIGIENPIIIHLPPTVLTPQNSPEILDKIYRTSYLTNRGIPVSTKMLIIIDTCYSEHMTYFPFIYESKSQSMISTSNYNIEIGTDLPFCVTISSCESHKTTKIGSSGSSLTKILYMQLVGFKGRLNIAQLHYLIYNSRNELIDKLIRKEATHPIITSTVANSEKDIPFFSLNQTKIVKVIEK